MAQHTRKHNRQTRNRQFFTKTSKNIHKRQNIGYKKRGGGFSNLPPFAKFGMDNNWKHIWDNLKRMDNGVLRCVMCKRKLPEKAKYLNFFK